MKKEKNDSGIGVLVVHSEQCLMPMRRVRCHDEMVYGH